MAGILSGKWPPEGGILSGDLTWRPEFGPPPFGQAYSIDPELMMRMADGPWNYSPDSLGAVNSVGPGSDAWLRNMALGKPTSEMGGLEAAVTGAGQFAMPAAPVIGMVRTASKAARAAELPMDYASRMERAKAMGFRTDQRVYHGSGSPDIKAFDLARGGATSGSEVGRMGVSVALEPEVADEFAAIAAKKTGGNAQTYPLLVRKSKAAAVTLDGSETNQEIAATLADAWGRGYDAILFRNYTTPGGAAGKNILIVKDPAQLRSPAAAFDPAARDRPGIMLSAGVPAGSDRSQDDKRK